jgi:hypothetical protein
LLLWKQTKVGIVVEASKHPHFNTGPWKIRGHVNMYIYKSPRTGKTCDVETKTPWSRETESTLVPYVTEISLLKHLYTSGKSEGSGSDYNHSAQAVTLPLSFSSNLYSGCPKSRQYFTTCISVFFIKVHYSYQQPKIIL